jgi:predicted transcriptional regulator
MFAQPRDNKRAVSRCRETQRTRLATRLTTTAAATARRRARFCADALRSKAAIARKVAEAEAGLDVSKLRPRRGRPPMGSAAADPFPVRLDPELRHAVDERAAADDTTASEVIRTALREFLRMS